MSTIPPAINNLYYTYIPYGRDPEGKLHLTIGGAKASFRNDRRGYLKGGELWQMVDGEWVLLYAVERGEGKAPWTP